MYSKKLVKVFLGLHKSVTGHLFRWTQIGCIFLCAFPAWNRAFRTYVCICRCIMWYVRAARGHTSDTV